MKLWDIDNHSFFTRVSSGCLIVNNDQEDLIHFR